MIVGIALGLLCIAGAYRLASGLHNVSWRKWEKLHAPVVVHDRLYASSSSPFPNLYTTIVRKEHRHSYIRWMAELDQAHRETEEDKRKEEDDG